VAKNTKTSTSKLNLKVQNIKINLHLEPSKTNHGLKIENASLGGNWLSKK
jgi:hypothetical protein